MRHTVVISDIHLSEVERGSGLWMRYRQRPFVPDAEIARMLAAVRRAVDEERRRDAGGAELTLVLGGDVFDLDAPRVVGGESVPHDLPRTAEHAVPALAAILDDHPVFVAALGQVLAEGHTLVVLSGNHDVELTLPAVRELLAARVVASASPLPRRRDELRERILFRAWFHLTPDGILIEHGNQYDSRCSYRSPMAPFLDGGREIEPSFGSLVARHLAARVGTLNPHDERTFQLSSGHLAAHWARHYLFSRRSIALTWLGGASRVILALRRAAGSPVGPRARRARRRADVAAAARETGAPIRAVSRHARLAHAPIAEETRRVLHELLVDRVAVATAATLGGAALIALASGRTRLASFFAPLVFLGYARALPKPPLNEGWRRIGGVAREIARIHEARAVIFGHTHEEAGAFGDDGVFIGNSGSWSATIDGDKPAQIARPVIWLRSGGDRAGALSGGLYAWIDGRLEPRATRGDGDQSRGTQRVSATPGIDAANASMKNVVKPSLSTR